MNVVMTQSGRFVEVQGTAEGAPFSRDRARRAARAWPSTASRRSSTLQAEVAGRSAAPAAVTLVLVARLGQPRQGGGDPRHPRRGAPDVELRPRPADVPRGGRDAETLEDNARLKARALVRGHRPAGRRRRHRARGRRARRRARGADGPLRRASTRPTPTTWPSCSRRWRRRRPAGTVPHRGAGRAGPTGVRCAPRARSRADRRGRRGDGGFGYDPVFVPEGGDGRTFAELGRRGQAPDCRTGRSRLPAPSPPAPAARREARRHQPRRSTGQVSTTSSPSTRCMAARGRRPSGRCGRAGSGRGAPTGGRGALGGGERHVLVRAVPHARRRRRGRGCRGPCRAPSGRSRRRPSRRGLTEITVASDGQGRAEGSRAWRRPCPSGRSEPAWISVTQC